MQTDDTAAAPATALFISHCTRDRALVDAWVDLVNAAGVVPSGQCFCSSHGGLANGQDFTAVILQQLVQARSVVALITPEALRSSGVIAEAAVAQSRGRLRYLVVPQSMGVVAWPMNAVQGTPAADPAKVSELLRQLAREQVPPAALRPGPAWRTPLDRFCAVAAGYRPPNPAWRHAAWVGALVAAVGLTFVLQPTIMDAWHRLQRVDLALGRPAAVGGAQVTLGYVSTFPLKYLPRRLYDAAGKTQAPAAQVGRAFAELAHSTVQRVGRLGEDDADEAEAIVRSWKGEAGSKAPDQGQPKAECGTDRLQVIENRWCQLMQKIPDATASKALDDTRFAVLSIRTDDNRVQFEAVALGSRPRHLPGYRVTALDNAALQLTPDPE